MKKVAIITRTKNRSRLLRRAMRSVLEQTYKDYIWVVVNDGGTPSEVDEVVCDARTMGIDVSVFHNSISLGMESASNTGIKGSASQYIVIHDDDDSWEANFLDATVRYLDNNKDNLIKCVITHSLKIKEVETSSSVKIISKKPYNCSIANVSLIDIAGFKNNPPPISLVFHRSLMEEIGYFDERLPVLGDWDFLIRYMAKYNIGVIPEALANYHVREKVFNKSYGNSIVSAKNVHKQWENFVIEKYLRDDIKQGKTGIGYLLLLVNKHENIRYQLLPVRVTTNAIEALRYLARQTYCRLQALLK